MFNEIVFISQFQGNDFCYRKHTVTYRSVIPVPKHSRHISTFTMCQNKLPRIQLQNLSQACLVQGTLCVLIDTYPITVFEKNPSFVTIYNFQCVPSSRVGHLYFLMYSRWFRDSVHTEC